MNNILSKVWNVIARCADFLYTYTYWAIRDIRYGMLCRDKDDLLNRLLVAGHIIEKGITMPNRRLGFGQGVIRLVISLCDKCIRKYGNDYDQLQLALDDLDEYLRIHKEQNVSLPQDIVDNIERLVKYKKNQGKECEEYSKEEFFRKTNSFKDFAESRHTSRWYNGKLAPNDLLMKAVKLAMTAPSACNRQSVRVKIAEGESKDKIVELQNGNRGFGDKIGQMIVITSNQKAWSYNFRTSAYLDGGIFVMNLLYALHYYGICACTLNAHLTIKQQNKVRQIINADNSELIIAFIAIGMPTEKMMIAKSSRVSLDNILSFV